MQNLIAIVVILALVGPAAMYVYKAKKSGARCVGCSAGCCGGKCPRAGK